MRWQRVARLAIAAFVLAFTAFVFVTLRRSAPPAAPEGTPRTTPEAIAETLGGTFTAIDDRTGALRYEVDFERQITYPDNRTVLKNAVITLPDREGTTVTITTGEMETTAPGDADGTVGVIKASSGVRLETSDGLVVTSADATYDDANGFLQVPGDVQFARGRMRGSGVGATYDRDRDVLWLLDRAQIDVAPDEGGAGAATGRAKAAGLARGEHYVRLTGDASITSDGQTMDAQDITIQLTPDDRAIRTIALRGGSRITGAGGGTGAEGMSARDIDLTYAEDGRTLQQARLAEEAEVSLAGGAAARRIAGRTIDMALGPDGSTVTALTASGNVELELPAEGNVPPRRINAPALTAGGPGGLQTATFSGGTTYRELKRGPEAAERHARAHTLVVETQPGLGAVTEADFRGDVRIEEGGTTAEGRRAIYRVAEDRFDLMPSADPGPASTVNDGRVNVTARAIEFGIGTQVLRAEGDVRSSIQPQGPKAEAPGTKPGSNTAAAEGGKLPALLEDGEPVNVTADRLEYKGAEGLATYTGHALLFQNKTSVRGDTIVLDDRKANLTAIGHVRSVMFLEEADATTKAVRVVQTIAAGDRLVYEDATRLATYTTGPTAKAHLVGSQGDVTAARIRLFLHEASNQLERAEADEDVVLKEGQRTATGDHLTYTPATEAYVMRGRPVVIEDRTPDGCSVTEAVSVTFYKTANNMTITANGVLPATMKPCGP